MKYIFNNQLTSRFGWTISKQVGIAVLRNKYKRWICEIMRKQEIKEQECCLDINFIFKGKKGDFYKKISYQQFNNTFLQVLRDVFDKAGKSKQESFLNRASNL